MRRWHVVLFAVGFLSFAVMLVLPHIGKALNLPTDGFWMRLWIASAVICATCVLIMFSAIVSAMWRDAGSGG